MYALAVFALLVVYFVLTHLQERWSAGSDYDSRYSYGAGSVAGSRRHSGRGKLIKGALAGAGIYALVDRFRSRRRKDRDDGPEVVGSRRHSGSYLEDEKYSEYGRDPDRESRWGNRLMKIAIPLGAAGLAARFLDRRHKDRDSDTATYGPPLGGVSNINPGGSGAPPPPMAPVPPGAPGPYGRPPPVPGPPVPPGQPLPSGQHPLNRPPSSMTYSSSYSASNAPRRGHGLRDGLATLGVIGLAKSIWNRRRDRKEDERLDQEHEARMSGGHLTGDGHPPRHHRRHASSVDSRSSLTGHHPQTAHGIPPIPAGTFAPGTAGATQLERERLAREERERRAQEALPLGGVPRPVSMPPMPADTQGILHQENDSRSDSVASASVESREHHHSGRNAAAAGIGGAAVGLAAGEALASRRNGSTSGRGSGSLPPPPRNQTSGTSNTASPPVSVKVRMHDNGRKVTLRRLPEEEARAEREARRTARLARRRGTGSGSVSVSSLSGSDVGGRPGHRFRRRDAQQQQQNEEAMRLESERLAEARRLAQTQQQPGIPNTAAGPSSLPPPPPIPESSPRPPGGNLSAAGGSGVGSPGTYDGGTSGGSDYAAQRRRRRAERAQNSQSKKTVGFE